MFRSEQDRSKNGQQRSKAFALYGEFDSFHIANHLEWIAASSSHLPRRRRAVLVCIFGVWIFDDCAGCSHF